MTIYLLNIKFWVDIAQIITALIATIGVVLSFGLSRKALKEVQRDRIFNQRPFLLFEYGGHVIPIEFKTHQDGKIYNHALWPSIGSGPGLHIPTFGQLKNYGTGPAIDVMISWIVEEVQIKGEKIKIDKEKRMENQYKESWNTNPLKTTHLFAGQETGIHLIPHFISIDFEHKIERANGYFSIFYSDTFGHKYKTLQKFHVFTDYKHPEKGFHTTFSDLIKNENYYS
jgi:hypothetical protein